MSKKPEIRKEIGNKITTLWERLSITNETW
jgi:hypothetical protein